MLKKMREEQDVKDYELKKHSQLKKNKSYLPSLYDKDGEIQIQKFMPSAKQLIGMTPAQKQSVITKLKYVKQKAHQQEQEDPVKIKDLVQRGEINPCDAF